MPNLGNDTAVLGPSPCPPMAPVLLFGAPHLGTASLQNWLKHVETELKLLELSLIFFNLHLLPLPYLFSSLHPETTHRPNSQVSDLSIPTRRVPSSLAEMSQAVSWTVDLPVISMVIYMMIIRINHIIDVF